MTAAASHDAARLADARAHLEAAREPRATGPGPDVEALRAAYLDLLKLALCDLAGPATTSVGAMADGTVMSRELRGDERRLRAAGMDWPLHGLTMVGLGRLDDLQACVEDVVRDGVEGDLVEAGAWRGGAAILMRAALDCLGDERTVWVADSFQGFPDDDAPDDGGVDLRAFDFLAVPVEEVRESFARLGCERGVRFVPGFFEQTLPALARRRWAIVRLDADSYEATALALRCLYPGLAVGGHLIVDDYGSFEGCRRAVDEFRAEHGIAEPIDKVDSTCVRWRRESGDPIETAVPPASAAQRGERMARPAPHVPTAREVELAGELAAARERLAAAEAQIGLRAWVRRRLARSAAR
jgi:Macrocin-O-methyltransferase (TylF)